MTKWPKWTLLTREISQLLLVSYSALNPLAYCGDLVFRYLLGKPIRNTLGWIMGKLPLRRYEIAAFEVID